jgi:hypothetical protein
MATNGILKFQGANKATFVGATSNVVIDTVKSSLGIGVDVDGPTSNLHVVGNAYVSTELTVGGTVTAAGFAGPLTGAVTGDGSGLTALNATNITTGTLDAARIPTLDQNTTGSAATLTTAQTIGGVSFDGSAAIVPTTFNGAAFNGDVAVNADVAPRTTLHVGKLLTSSDTTIPASDMGIAADFPNSTSAWFANRNGANQDDYWGIGYRYNLGW